MYISFKIYKKKFLKKMRKKIKTKKVLDSFDLIQGVQKNVA